MFCPKCKSEYIKGYTHCKKCDVDLIDELPQEPKEENAPSIDLVKIRYSPNSIDTAMAMDLLRQNNIPCLSKYREAGEYLSISAGFSVFGEDIFVDRKNVQAALDLLNDWDKNREAAEVEPDDTDYRGIPFFQRPGIAIRITLAFSAVSVTVAIIMWIVDFFKNY